MQDLQQYQYYDPAPRPTILPWWRRKRTWQLAMLLALSAGVLVFVGIAATNVLKHRRLANVDAALFDQADAVTSRLGAECDAGDTACLDRARADAARSLGLVQACDTLTGDYFTTCVTLIAQDKQSPEVCQALTGEDQTACADSAYLLKARTETSLAFCEQMSVGPAGAACYVQIRARLVAEGRCEEAGVEISICEAEVALTEAIASGDPVVCAALADEQSQNDCDRAINSVDEDNDNLVLTDEVRLGLSDNLADADADGLSDGDEVHIHHTDPTKADTDTDGFADGVEVSAGYDPLK